MYYSSVIKFVFVNYVNREKNILTPASRGCDFSGKMIRSLLILHPVIYTPLCMGSTIMIPSFNRLASTIASIWKR